MSDHTTMEEAFDEVVKQGGESMLAKYKEWPPKESSGIQADKSFAADRRCCRHRKMPNKDVTKLPSREEKGFTDLWDIADARFLDKVSCKALIKIMSIDPKNSSFELRMRCDWKFRTQHGEERTETRLRVPGIRMPGLIVDVDESRIWRDMTKAKKSQYTVFWRGISVFSIKGFERFEMDDFPYDRQRLRLDLLEFVWRSDKDSMDHDFSMHICALTVETESMLPEWAPVEAFVHAENKTTQVAGAAGSYTAEALPDWASRFTVALRVERKNWFYIIQVFLLTILITICSCFPLLMPPTVDKIGNRLGLYAGGLLTLTAFKYGVADQLPSVPYSTKFDKIMFYQMASLVLFAGEALIAYRLVEDQAHTADVYSVHVLSSKTMGMVEDTMFACVVLVWSLVWFFLAADQLGFAWGMKPKTWCETMADQDSQHCYKERYEDDYTTTSPKIQGITDTINKINKDIMANMNALRADNGHPPSQVDVDNMLQKTARLQQQRAEMEEILQRQSRTVADE